MNDNIIQIIAAGMGTIGFALYFNIAKRNLFSSFLGGLISWSVYLLAYRWTYNLFYSYLIAAGVVGLYSEIMARVMKAPTNIFLVPGIIPLLPGGSFYYTMSSLLSRNYAMFNIKSMETATIVFGIVSGIMVASLFFTYYIEILKLLKKKV